MKLQNVGLDMDYNFVERWPHFYLEEENKKREMLFKAQELWCLRSLASEDPTLGAMTTLKELRIRW
jgi:hypothetical protein